MDKDLDPAVLRVIEEEARPFKEAVPFEERFLEYQVVRCNHPGVIPLACSIENYTGASRFGLKLYVSEDILAGHFRAFLKKALMKRFPAMSSADNLLMMVEDDVIVKYDVPLKDIYAQKAEKDGWLFLKLSIEH